MSFLPPSSTSSFLSFYTACRRCIARPSPGLRFASTAASRNAQLPRPAFGGLGLSLGAIQGLQAAFPVIRDATEAQRQFIPAIMGGKNLLLKGPTGSGKSFGLVLALLSKYRPPGPNTRPKISTLLIVPHRDLAYQFLHWIERVVYAVNPSQSVPSLAQVLVRSSSTSSSQQAAQLRENPPHLLIGTPQAILDAIKENPTCIDLKGLSTVAVDEVDYLIDYVPSESTKFTKTKIELRMRKHPTPAKQLLDMIYAERIAQDNQSLLRRAGSKVAPPDSLPQLVLCSATFRSGLRQQIFASKWLGRGQGELVKVKGEAIQNAPEEEDQDTVIGGRNVQHCALVVSENGDIRNIDGAVEAEGISSQVADEEEPAVVTASSDSLPVDLPELPEVMLERFSMTASPFHPPVMEAIAAAFAVDVPGVAMLVLPASAPVQRAVYELRMLGVNAVGLDLLSNERGRSHLLRGSGAAVEENPTLLVTTLATTRGLDLPDLSHVFILGVCTARKVDSYLHLAGRVGRFGRGGKVVSVLEERREVVNGEKRTWKDEPRQYSLMLKTLGLQATRHESFY
ncbi:P-loop containing nucleoside triphosphate hydrolase protein [Dentipellis sp. KUC8613]|nr:P-loop containing nucleoside triphosphate hydrolase protein [Dentipellis sp. KUC8613]